MEGLKLSGRLHVEVRSKDGKLKDEIWINNIITNAGKALIASLAGDAAAVPFTYLAVGTSTTAVAATDTTLTAESTTLGMGRAAATISRVTTTATNDTLQAVHTWTASGSITIEEVGLFNDPTAGTMLGHALTTSKILVTSDTLTVTYQVKFA